MISLRKIMLMMLLLLPVSSVDAHRFESLSMPEEIKAAVIRCLRSFHKEVFAPAVEGMVIGGAWYAGSYGLELLAKKSKSDYDGLLKLIGSCASLCIGVGVVDRCRQEEQTILKFGIRLMGLVVTMLALPKN